MRWIEQVIEAHKRDLLKRPLDRRKELIEYWENWQADNKSGLAIEKSLELVADGSASERELGFYILMDIGIREPSQLATLSQLAAHRSAAVRGELAFRLSRDLPQDFQKSVYTTLLKDKSASVRAQTIRRVGMCHCKYLLPELRELRSQEKNEKVNALLDYWIPLLEVGYRVEPFSIPGMLTVTALAGDGIASRNVNATDPNDPAVLHAVEELKNTANFHSTES